MHNLGSRIRALRIKHGYTQAEFAEVLGYARTSVSRMELEDIEPPLWCLVGIADLFGLTLDELIGREVKPVETVEYYTTEEVAKRAGVSINIVYRYTHDGIISPIRKGKAKSNFYEAKMIDKIIEYRKWIKTYEKE